MELDADKLLEESIRCGVREGVRAQLNRGYQNPLDKMIETALVEHGQPLRSLISDAIKSTVSDPVFRREIMAGVREHIAKALVKQFGGEIQKQVNALKSNPATRERIVMALEDIAAQKPTA